MENCLLKKIKGNVSANLPIYDAIRLVVDWNGIDSFPIKPDGGNWYIGGSGVGIKVTNGTIKVDDVSVGSEYQSVSGEQAKIDVIPVSSIATTQIVLKGLSSITTFGRSNKFKYNNVSTDDMEFVSESSINFNTISIFRGVNKEQDIASLLFFPNKNVVSTINFGAVTNSYKGDISVLGQFPSLIAVQLALAKNNPNVYGDISVFENNTTITNIVLRDNDGIVGMIDSLSGCTALTSIDLQSTKIGGNIASLGTCTNITNMILPDTSITGTIEGLVAAFVDDGHKNSGSITINIGHTGVTFEGNFVTGTKTLAWNGKTNITLS